jgi:hypothetical protein
VLHIAAVRKWPDFYDYFKDLVDVKAVDALNRTAAYYNGEEPFKPLLDYGEVAYHEG